MRRDLRSVDLHAHTLYSDGSETPAALVRLAKDHGVGALSITDHDHTGGIDEALALGQREGVEVIPGIELSVSFAEFEDIHILGYYFTWQASTVQARLTAFRTSRETRGEQILARVNATLLAQGRAPLDYDVVKARVKGAFGRPHIAHLLIEHGYVPDMHAAFRDYLRPCDVPKQFFPAEEALALLHQAQGLAVIAHPKVVTSDRTRLRELLVGLHKIGLDGIETYRHDHDADDRRYFGQTAEQLGMLVTGGSDYHGGAAHRAEHDVGGFLGAVGVPYHVVRRLRQGYLARYPIAFLLLGWPAAAGAAMRRAIAWHYQLPLRPPPPPPLPGSTPPGSLTRQQSWVLPTTDAGGIDMLVASGEREGLRLVSIPWEGAGSDSGDCGYQTASVAPERFQRTPIERLAHELVHEGILAQLQ